MATGPQSLQMRWARPSKQACMLEIPGSAWISCDLAIRKVQLDITKSFQKAQFALPKLYGQREGSVITDH